MAFAISAPLKGQTYSISQFHLAGSARGSIAVDGDGNVIYADTYASTIVRVSPTGGATVIAGAANQIGSADGVGGAVRFKYPTSVAVDATGNIYVVDAGNYTVRKISPDGAVTTLAGRTGASGYIDGAGQTAQFNQPGAIALTPTGDVVIADFDLSTSRFGIRKISPAGAVSTLMRSPASDSAGPVTPFSISGLAADREGNLFFADASGCTIRRVAPAGEISTVAGLYNQRGSFDGVGEGATFYSPKSIAVESGGNFLVVDADARTLRRITPSGAVTTIAGQPYPDTYSPSVLDGVGGSAVLRSIIAIASSRDGSIYLLSVDQWLSPNNIGSVLLRGTPTMAASRPILTQSPARDHPGANLNARNVGARASVSFSATAASVTPVSFQWIKSNVPIAGATQATLDILSASASDEGDYWVHVSNAAGQIVSEPVTMRVFSPAFDAFTSRHEVAGGSFLWGIASGAGQLVTVGTGGKIFTSSDGVTWTMRASGTTEWLLGITYGAGKWVAVGDRGLILVSRDGASWSRAASSGTSQRLNNVAFGGDRFVAVGETGTIVTSTDASTWTPQNSGVTTWLRGLVYDGGFYASGQSGVILAERGAWIRIVSSYFADTRYPFSTTRDIEALAAGGPIGIGQDGLAIAHYVGSIAAPAIIRFDQWRSFSVGLDARFRGLARGADAIFATGENGVVAAAQSFYGPWSFIPTGTTANLVSGVFHGNSMFIVGENETILQSQPLYQTRFINIATRGAVSPGSAIIAGFVVIGSAPKRVLVRAAGPALAKFGISTALSSPTLTLFDHAGRAVATNSAWNTSPDASAVASVGANVGAFPFAAASLDSAVLTTLEPGSYTAQVTGGAGATLVEVYDADVSPTPGARVVNISTRAQVGAGDRQLIAGFVINGAASRKVLIRAVGPSLAKFGLDGSLSEPQIELYDQRGRLLQRAAAWSTQPDAAEISASGVIAGAFALDDLSKDAALVTSLLPGSYTVQVFAVDRVSTGLALVEVYDLP